MASSFKEIEEYVPTQWHNYNPPSIDQINLKHIEDNIKINRDMINAIIKRLGEVPESATVADKKIYDDSIYDTLISFRDKLNALDDNKLDKTTYNNNLGDLSGLLGGNNLVSAINNRLRRDIDDNNGTHKLTLGNLASNGTLSVTGASTLTGNVSCGGTLSTSGKATLNSLEVTNGATLKNTLSVAKATTLSSTLSVTDTSTFTKKITANGGIGTTTLSTSGKATLNSLEVTGASTLKGALTVSGKTTVEELITNKCYMKFYESADSATRTLWIDKNVHSMNDTDVQLVTKA